MRISETWVAHLAADITAAVAQLDCVRLRAKEPDVAERIRRLIIENLKAEQALEEEAEGLAAKHARQMTGMDQRKIVEGIKARLAKERGFPL